MANNNDNETKVGEEDLLNNEHFSISVRQDTQLHYDITLSDDVNIAFVYEKLLATLRSLPANTVAVNLFLANSGGYVHGLIPLYNAFKYCVVPVDVHVTGECYSAGAMLALSGRSLTMYPNTILMFHNFSGGHFGKGKELIDAALHSNKHSAGVFKNMLCPFLTKEEVDGILNDKDVYVYWNSKNLEERKERFFNQKPKRVRRKKTNE
jgi:ATP-dependent protease ClpP protease subunit